MSIKILFSFSFSFLFLFQLSSIFSTLDARRIGLILATNYKGNQANIPPLKLCERDAKMMKAKLNKTGKFQQVEVLLGRMLTANNLGKKITKLAKMVTSKDTVLIYFSGHGTYQADDSAPNGMRNFLLMHKRPHLPDNLLDRWVKKIKTKNLVWIFDCCYSGGIASKSSHARGSGKLPFQKGEKAKVLENANENLYFGNKAIIGSSSANQTAIEVGVPINHGIFTYLFAQSLEPKKGDLNKDGTVTLLEAFEWTKPRVEKIAKRYNHRQTPILGGATSGIYLSGRLKPKPPKPIASKPKPTFSKPPDAVESAKPKPTPILPADPIGPTEPPVVYHSNHSSFTIYTTIFKSRLAGPTSSNPTKVLARNKKKDKVRRLVASLSGKSYPTSLAWLNHKELKKESQERIPLGVYSHRGKVFKNKVAKILLKKVPTGVYELKLLADDYPVITQRIGVNQDTKLNKTFIVASLSGYGSIQGKVFYKSFDQPVKGHRIYMPKISQTNQIHSMSSNSDGSFWFLNLKPANNYFIKASFAENLPLDNKKLTVQKNTTTQVDIILNTKLGLR